MLTTIDSAIRNRALVCLTSRSKKEIYKGLDVILHSYNKAGYYIKLIRGNNEFRPLLTDLEDDLDIELDFVAQGEHVPKAERNNRTIGERIQAGFHRLPFSRMPTIMLKTLAKISCRQLNYFPAKNDISPYYSLHMILNKQCLVYGKHCKIPFGAYVQAYQEEEKKNNNKPRTVDAIYLEPCLTSAGGHWIMNLETGKRMHKGRC